MEKTVKFYRVGSLMVMCVPFDKDTTGDDDNSFCAYYIKKYSLRTDCFKFAFGTNEEWSEEEIQEHEEYFEDCWDAENAYEKLVEDALDTFDNEGGN